MFQDSIRLDDFPAAKNSKVPSFKTVRHYAILREPSFEALMDTRQHRCTMDLVTVPHAAAGKHGLALHHAVPAAVEVTGSFSWDQGGGQEFYPGRPRPHRPNHRGAHCSGTTAH